MGYTNWLCARIYDDQDFALQEDTLKDAGCEKIFYDKICGSGSERVVLKEAFDDLRDGEDTLVIWRLDRLGRSLKNLIELINLLPELKERKVEDVEHLIMRKHSIFTNSMMKQTMMGARNTLSKKSAR